MDSSSSPFAAALEAACEAALAHLENFDRSPVGPASDLETLRRHLGKPLAKQGVPAEQVIAELTAGVDGGIIRCAGGRFFAWVIGGALPAALAADWLTAAWDQNAVLHASAPAAMVVEEIAGEWLKEILGLPAGASFAIVSGCQMAHATCLAAARHALLAKRGWDVEEQGLFGAPAIRILAGSEKHASTERAIRLLGIGREQIKELPTDGVGRLQGDALKNELESDPTSPAIVLMQAGDIHTGVCDDFEALIPMARSHDAWVHVDGAFGLWAAASPRYRHLVKGVERADSWATDGHKWLNVPFDCGYAFVAHPEAHRAAMSLRASYLTFGAEARDAIHWNPEWSRRARGFPTYAALRQLGQDGVADLVERCCAHAHSLVTRIGRLPGVEILCEPTLNQGLVRFLDSRAQATESDHARRTDAVISAVNASGEAYFAASDWRGRRVMRVSVCNWQTSDRDMDRAVAAVAQALNANSVGSNVNR